jgi:hypothetical protein
MVGALVIVVGVVLMAVGVSLGTFHPLPGYDSPIPTWLGWSSALFGALVTVGGILKSIQEAKAAVDQRRARAIEMRRNGARLPIRPSQPIQKSNPQSIPRTSLPRPR